MDYPAGAGWGRGAGRKEPVVGVQVRGDGDRLGVCFGSEVGGHC